MHTAPNTQHAALPDGALPPITLQGLLETALPAGKMNLRQPIQQPRARRTVESIFRAARDMMLRGGAFTVPDLAAEAAITEPTFYRYFTGTDHLLREAVRRVAQRRTQDWVAALDSLQFHTLAEAATAMADLGTRSILAINGLPAPAMRRFLPHIDMIAAEIVPPIAKALREAMRRNGLAEAERITDVHLHALLVGMFRMATSIAARDLAMLRHEQSRGMAAAMLLAGFEAAAR